MVHNKLTRTIHLVGIDPFLNVPNEILPIIFKFCLSGPIVIPGSRDGTDFPWVSRLVCQRWRSIAEGFPELWTSVLVDYGRVNSTKDRVMDAGKVTDIACRVLSRSKRELVSLRIECSLYPGDYQPLVRLVIEHAHRFRHFEFKIIDIALNEIFERIPLVSDRLEFLSIASFGDSITKIPSGFKGATALKALEVRTWLDWLEITPYIVWDNLAYLSMTGRYSLSPTAAVQVLLNCPNLITLQVSLELDEESMNSAPSKFPSMTTLIVEASEWGTFDDLLGRLDLPSLTRLELRSQYQDDDNEGYWEDPSLHLHIPKYTQLKILKIAFPIPGDYDLLSLLLPNIPNIVELTLPLLSHSALGLLASNQVLAKLQTLRTYVPPRFLEGHLAVLDKRAQDNPDLPHLRLCSLSNHPVESILRENDANVSSDCRETAPVELVRVQEVHTKMRDFVPSYLKPQW
ncbi:hypothetical protein BDZ94DRAFT_1265666 [Collybia nuda]|uniref:F-box domain-containing protein n=1 Tax=Collybia nuda TaxID=64659 RepID=A0A9P6CFV4_9AGAR|nr:hypothetical protein BDZ94DRAFT_1265666 [Collybia nuda]